MQLCRFKIQDWIISELTSANNLHLLSNWGRFFCQISLHQEVGSREMEGWIEVAEEMNRTFP